MMSGTFIALPVSGGSLYWGDPVANFAALPVTTRSGESHLALDTGVLYYWNGSAWVGDASLAGATVIGEQLAATTTGVGATGVFGNVVSASLTPGTWLLSAMAGFDQNGADTTQSISAAITASASAAGISTVGATVYPFISAWVDRPVIPAPTVTVTLGSTTTYYLNTRVYYPSGSPRHFGRLEARYLGG